MRVEVVPYSPQWPNTFNAIKCSLETALQSVSIVGIEHVGSTSVPGLAAKPIIDVDVVVTRPNLPFVVNALKYAGYVYVGERGIPDRYALREPDLDKGHPHTRNLYVCIEGCISLRNHIEIRNLLRIDPALRDEYAAVKLALAEKEFDSVDAYAEAKTEILQKLLAIVGIEKADLSKIANINQRIRDDRVSLQT